MTDINQIAKGLSVSQRRRLLAMSDGEMSASCLGATGSDSTRLMREMNRNAELIERKYLGGRHRYRLTSAGRALRTHLKGLPND